MSLAAAVLFTAVPVRAQMTGNVGQLSADLHGEDLNRAVAAASALGSLRTVEARDALMGALQLGAPPKLLGALIEALGLHKSAQTVKLLRHYASNRNPAIRVAALNALGEIAGKPVDRVLIRALSDSNPMIRARAARLLGERRTIAAERPLFQMLRNGDVAAAPALGMVAGVETARQLAELINELPASALAGAFGTMLQRKDFGPDPLRTEVVKALGNLPGGDATAALVEYVASVPSKEVRLSKRKAEELLERRQQ